ncbi:hypothetical protein Ahy_A09g041862 isoform E [Arachis hypogaea]|uniref:GRAM domain-containing protein n=1 Tax=Arachis hypogaea TaxID=3818 RepID=A0A445BE34_ARAHY|nr:hypothetical protein Ahy_A09g041862 isoform E [Arachis hypogaea]
MKKHTSSSLLQDLFIGNPIISAACDQLQKSVNRYYLNDSASTQSQCSTKASKQSKTLNVSILNKLRRKAEDNLSQGIQEHVRLAPKISETIKGKLSLGTKILQVGGVDKVFEQFFNVREGERLLKASPCYLSSTSGPLAGLLFISTDKVAFCSERSIKAFNGKGQMIRIHYKVSIPLKKIKCVNQRENFEKPKQKYIQIVTVDKFDFWLMGVIKYQKTLRYLEQAISLSQA